MTIQPFGHFSSVAVARYFIGWFEAGLRQHRIDQLKRHDPGQFTDIARCEHPGRPPDDDPTEVTATQIRDLLRRLCEAGQWCEGDPQVLFVLDSGYDIVRLSWLLREEPVRLLGRIRADRVTHHPAGRRRGPTKGRQPPHRTGHPHRPGPGVRRRPRPVRRGHRPLLGPPAPEAGTPRPVDHPRG
ncbi:transposase [Streptomyces sp. NPDC056480]|uniref:transposase n=1 Tax=Streptomyces sp. NPDC056480 TaxID=3345833 RepID=UPI00368153EA